MRGSAVHLPTRYQTMAQARDRMAAAGSSFVPPPGLLEDLTGVRGVHLREDGEQASDLAARAAVKALAVAGVAIDEVDLLLFASTSQDLVEPATAHIVAAELGATCPVFDVKNACNSILNALEVACAFIEIGRYETVLIACGETPSLASRWHVPNQEAFFRALPGYTVSDAGAALVVTSGPAGEDEPGVRTMAFGAKSTAWRACTVESGGSLHWRPADLEPTYIRLNADALRGAATDHAADILPQYGPELDEVRASDFIAFHQISLPQFHEVRTVLRLPEDRCLPSVVEHGNAASASLPLQLALALESNWVGPGDQVALIGLASGYSAGLAIIRL